MSKSHFFFAVPLPKTVKLQLKDVCQQLSKEYPFKRWVHEEDYHITLAFLGDAESNQLEKPNNLVETLMIESASFTLNIEHLGIFGLNENPRILWAGTSKSDELSDIRDRVYNKCIEIGFKLDKKPFKPHITLARKWNASHPFMLEKIKRYLPRIPSFEINEIVLYETKMDESPKYKVRKRFEF